MNATSATKYRVGDRIRFADEYGVWTVQAISASGRYMAVTRPFAARHTVLYSMVDLVEQIRGVDDSLGNSIGYETREDCECSVRLFDSGEFGFSHRKRPIPLVVSKETSQRVSEITQC